MYAQDDFISLFLNATKEYESPSSFWRWSAYGLIAATLRTNVYHLWATSRLYPNIYILLLANSAKFRKDAPLKFVESLAREMYHTKVISGKASWQGIVDELSQNIGIKGISFPLKEGSAIIIAPELSQFFVADPQLIPNLTEGYDYMEEFPYTLRGGKVTVKNRCITLLAASNETMLRDVYDVKALYGGLLRRTLLIKPDERRRGNALMDESEIENNKYRKVLIDSLNKIKLLKGEIIKTQEAKQLYKDWYLDLYEKYDNIEDKTGFFHGMHALVFKIAIILTTSEYKLEITKRIVEEAIIQVTSLQKNYTEYAMGTGKAPHANIGAIIMIAIWNSKDKKLSRREILASFWNEIIAEDFDKLAVTWEQAGLIRTSATNNEIAYELTQKAKDIFAKNEKIAKANGIV